MKPFEGTASPKKRINVRKCLVCQIPTQPLFRCPQKKEVLEEWLRFCKSDNIPKSKLLLCVRHFSQECITTSPSGKIVLKSGSIPSVMPPENNVSLQRKKTSTQYNTYCYLCGRLEGKNSIFKFPKEGDDRRSKWIDFCSGLASKKRRELRPDIDKLCSLHFQPHDVMMQEYGRCILKSTAIPTIHVIDNGEKSATAQPHLTSYDEISLSETMGNDSENLLRQSMREKSCTFVEERDTARMTVEPVLNSTFGNQVFESTPHLHCTSVGTFHEKSLRESIEKKLSMLVKEPSTVPVDIEPSLVADQNNSESHQVCKAVPDTYSTSAGMFHETSSRESITKKLVKEPSTVPMDIEPILVVDQNNPESQVRESAPDPTNTHSTSAGMFHETSLRESIKKKFSALVKEPSTVPMDIEPIPVTDQNTSNSQMRESTPDTHCTSTSILESPAAKLSTPTTSGKQARRRLRFIGDIRTPDLATPRRRSECLKIIRYSYKKMLKENRNLKRQTMRLQQRVRTLRGLVSHLQKKKLVSENAALHLKEGTPPQILMSVCRRQNMSRTSKYSKDILSFALTLQFYSSKGYEYVRKKFGCLLPSVVTLRKYYCRVDATPGFSEEAFRFLKARSRTRRNVVNIVMDEMSIHRGLQTRGNRTYGFVNLGELQQDSDNLPMATQALVFLAVGLKENFRIPIGYFLVNSIGSEDQANLMSMALKMLDEIGVSVHSMTFDGTAKNFATVEILGANLQYGTAGFQPWFLHPSKKHKIYVIPDVCHMLKLVRNRLGRTMWHSPNEAILNSKGEKISFKHINDLYELQEEQGLHAANKLTKLHIDYMNKIMNVRLAAQTLSRSVSIALNVAEEEGYLKGVGATAEFCEIFNDVFDILNVRSLFPQKIPKNPRYETFRKPLNDANFEMLRSRACDAIKYIEGLVEDNQQGMKLIHSSFKTGFVGLIITLINTFQLFTELKSENFNGEFHTLLTYRLVQDYIENFFSCIRQRGGFNDNPTALQFEIAFKYMLIHTEIRSSETGNCELDDIEILDCSSTRYRAINGDEIDPTTMDRYDLDFDFPEDIIEDVNALSSFVQEVVKYVSGFVSLSVGRHTNCSICKASLTDPRFEEDCRLLFKKNMGGLSVPSDLVYSICLFGESEFRRKLKKSTNFDSYVKDITRRFLSIDDIMIPSVQCPHHEHALKLKKLILKTYIIVRIHYECKKMSLPIGKSVRQKLHKLTQNMNQ